MEKSVEAIFKDDANKDDAYEPIFAVREKYRPYKLDALAKQMLNDQKADVDYEQIPMVYK